MKTDFTFRFDRYASLAEMPEDEQRLVEQAELACATAHAPYSNFHVGAAALLESGRMVIGSNQESEVYPAGICAERNLLFHHQALSPDDRIVKLAIASDPSWREAAARKSEIIAASFDKATFAKAVEELYLSVLKEAKE